MLHASDQATAAFGRWLAEAISYAFGAHGASSPMPPLVDVQPYVDRPHRRH
jgi:hypothetical protein